MEKIIKVGNREYRMRASALIPKLYRARIGRDMISDMARLQKKMAEAQKSSTEDEETAQLNVMDLTIFENVAWVMIKAAGEDVGDSPDEWLDSIDGVFSIYEVMPEILELWGLSNKTTSSPKNLRGRR